MTRKRLYDIEDLAFNIIKNSGLSKHPVNVQLIAEQYAITIIFYAFTDDICGVLVEKDKTFTIGINKDHHINRQRFTIAHELGHYFLKHQRQGIFVDENPMNQSVLMFRDSFSSTGENSQEREANAFAAALLMPRVFIENYIKENNVNLVEELELEKMAKSFNVSTGAMAFRLSNLNVFI
jgi:Zn-dependent peptidase ImmA (M78 family)